MNKSTYRRYWLERRKTFQAEKIQTSQEALMDSLSNLGSQIIFSCFNIENELPTRKTLCSTWHYHQTLVPRIKPQNRSTGACPIRSKKDLVAGPFHLIEASIPAHRRKIDFCLVPGLVFDLQDYRIGYGGGCYDRFLRDHPYYCTGLYPEEQIAPDLDPAFYNIPARALFTGRGLREI